MFYVTKFIESLILPPGIFILLVLAVGFVVFRHSRTIGAFIFAIAIAIYLASTALVAYAVIRPLEACYAPPAQPQGDVLVMLGGGATIGTPGIPGAPPTPGRSSSPTAYLGNLTGDGANRLITTAMLYRQTHLPILLTSGPMEDTTSQSIIAKNELVALGVPASKILTENNSLNTLQNARDSKPILLAHKFTHPILITSAYHMRRAVLDFNRTGISVTPYPCGYYADRSAQPVHDRFLPSAAALSTTETALHEYIGILATRLGIGG